jgi:hypothetical protein
MILEKMLLEKMILDRTLPAGAVPARLLRSGEYSIRGTFDLISKSSLYWFADAMEHGSRLQGYSQTDCRHCCTGYGSLWLDAPFDCG